MKIRDMKGRTDNNSGYKRVFDNEELGSLISKIQATVISNGSELERIILSKSTTISNLETFIEDAEAGTQANGTYICSKRVVQKSKKYSVKINGKGIEPDLLIFIVEQHRICKVIELKDGDTFDTKKSLGERNNLETFKKEFGSKIPFTTSFYICSFNQNDKKIIKEGFKNIFNEDEILTGEELCEILNINYTEIINQRKNDAKDNLDYFINELLKIDIIKDKLKDKI